MYQAICHNSSQNERKMGKKLKAKTQRSANKKIALRAKRGEAFDNIVINHKKHYID